MFLKATPEILNFKSLVLMVSLIMILGFLLGLICLTEASRFDITSNKKSRHNPPEEENILSTRVQSMILNDTPPSAHVPDFISQDRVLNICHRRIPQMSKEDIYAMLDEAILNENFGLVKVVALRENLAELVDFDQIEALCRSSSEVSADILEYIVARTGMIKYFDWQIKSCLFFCVPFGFKKFKILWEAFKAENLPNTFLADILTKISSPETKHFYDFFLEKIVRDNEKFSDIFKKSIAECTIFGFSKKMVFLLENGLSLSYLDRQKKLGMLFVALNANNCFLLSYLLKDLEVIAHAKVMAKPPWITAVENDYPEVLEVLIKTFTGIEISSLCMLAFSCKSSKVMKYFWSTGQLSSEILFRMALTSVQMKDLDSMQYLRYFGIPVDVKNFEGWNLLTTAIDRDALDIVEFLIVTCGMNPNELNIKYDESKQKTSFAPIYFAKTPAMVNLLGKLGAKVNTKFERVTHEGDVVISTTALHKAALESNTEMFLALIENGADIRISDAFGFTNEAFYAMIRKN